MSSRKLGYGIIGCGGIASGKHLKGYAKMEDIELVAACDVVVEKAEKVAREYNIPYVYRNYEELLARDDIDVVSVCVPNFLHAPIAIAALEAGKHVHCEKPIAMNASEAQKMVEAKNRTGKKLMVALNNRFTPAALFMKEYIKQGNLGEIYFAKCGWVRRRGIPGWGGWFTTKELSGGGPLIDLGVHFIDLAVYLMGNPKPVAVMGSTYSKFAGSQSASAEFEIDSKAGKYDVEDLAAGFIRFENGTSLFAEFSWASNIEEEYNYYELLGTKGGAKFCKGQLKIFSEINGCTVDIVPNLRQASAIETEIRHFIDCILEDKEPIARPEEAVQIMKIIDALYQSAATGSEVKIND